MARTTTRRTHMSLSLLLTGLLGLTGCGGIAPAQPPANGPITGPAAAPTAPPSFSPYTPALAASDARSGTSDAGIKLLGGSLAIEATDGKRPIERAVIDLYGPTLATGVTDAAGRASLGPLSPGASYTVVVRAPGFATLQQAALEIKQKMTTTVRLSLVSGAVATGHVTASGAPVDGAVVTDGLNSTLTDASGQFALSGVGPGPITLRAGKPRHQAATRAVSVALPQTDGLDLTLASSDGAIFFDARWAAGFDAARFTGLKQGLASRGWRLVDAPPPAPGDVWVLLCPSQAVDAATTAQATAFVAQGGKLVMLGEWGGFSGFDNPSTNALAHALGLHFNPDLIRESASGQAAEWLSIQRFEPLVFGAVAPQTVQFSNACSLFGLSGMRALATTGTQAFRVQAGTGARDVAMGGPFGAGKAIALGDASAWSDDDANEDGAPDAQGADNMLFWEKLLAW